MQQTFAEASFDRYRKSTRRERFLDEMNRVVWYFGMKAHVGVDSQTKLIHSVAATVANVQDSQVLPELLHGQETRGGVMRPTVGNATSFVNTPRRPRASSRRKPIAIGR